MAELLRWRNWINEQMADEGGLKLPIWPDGFSYRPTADEMVVLDARGRTIAQVGSPITMGGGETPRQHIRGLTEMNPDEAPCHGPYWLVGEIAPAAP